MRDKRFFMRVHPLPALLFFVAVLTVTLWGTNPVVSAVSLFCAVLFCAFIYGAKSTAESVGYTLPLMVLVVVVNGLFVHRGETYLFFLNDNPVTLEAILYGVGMSVTFAAVYFWCRCLTAVMTTDKWIFLFGKVLPKLGAVLALSVAFVPKFKRRYKQIDSAQRTLGVYDGKGIVDKLRYKMRVLSILLTNVFESGVTTADSMRARGFGMGGRSTYSPYEFAASDILIALASVVLSVAAVVVFALLGNAFVYYPTVSALKFETWDVVCLICATLLFVLPIICEIEDDLLWRSLRRRI